MNSASFRGLTAAAGLVLGLAAGSASAGPVELSQRALDAVTAGASANAAAASSATGVASTASTITSTLAVKVPGASSAAAAAGAGAGAGNPAGTAQATAEITLGVNGGQTSVSQSDTGALAAVLVGDLTASLSID